MPNNGTVKRSKVGSERVTIERHKGKLVRVIAIRTRKLRDTVYVTRPYEPLTLAQRSMADVVNLYARVKLLARGCVR